MNDGLHLEQGFLVQRSWRDQRQLTTQVCPNAWLKRLLRRQTNGDILQCMRMYAQMRG